jgi:hypothetical protein
MESVTAEPTDTRPHISPLRAGTRWPFAVLGAIFLALVLIRIGLQSITIDEGDTYVYWVSGKLFPLWQPNANNHLLNSYLIWVFTHLFGLNNFSMRLPSFIGAVLYVAATYRFCTAFVEKSWLQIPLFACFLLNPFVLDFFVAARGYGLALGFLTAAIVSICALLAQTARSRVFVRNRVAVISCCLALSLVSSFSFALVCVISLALFLAIWIVEEVRRPAGERMGGYAAIAAAVLLPGLLIVLALAGWTLLHWPKGQITTTAGGSSLRESWDTFLQFTFSALNPRILPPYLMRTFGHWRKALPWILITLTLVQICYLAASRKIWRYRPEANRSALVAGYVGGVLVLTFTAHWLAFRYAGLLLPKDRTSIFFLPLSLMVVGAVAGFPHSDRFGRGLRYATALLLIVGTAFFAGCLRLHYFLQWRFDADIKETYLKLAQVVGPGHQTKVPCWFLYTSALNYYREYFHDNSFASFLLWDAPERAPSTHYQPYPLDGRVYVLKFPDDEAFATQQHLKVVYRGPVSDVAIAARQ